MLPENRANCLLSDLNGAPRRKTNAPPVGRASSPPAPAKPSSDSRAAYRDGPAPAIPARQRGSKSSQRLQHRRHQQGRRRPANPDPPASRQFNHDHFTGRRRFLDRLRFHRCFHKALVSKLLAKSATPRVNQTRRNIVIPRNLRHTRSRRKGRRNDPVSFILAPTPPAFRSRKHRNLTHQQLLSLLLNTCL